MSTAEDSTSSERSIVSFGSIEIHEHAIVLGKGHPSASGIGPSLELDWEAQTNIVLDLDEYESMRECGFRKRSSNELVMPSLYRRKVLVDNGYTMREITEMACANDKRHGIRVPKMMKKLFKMPHH